MITSSNRTQTNLMSDWLSRTFTVRWELVAFVVILALAIFTRFFILGERVMSHDESLHTQFSYNLYRDGNFQHSPLMHGPILFHATAFSYYLFGDNDFSARIYTAVLGVLIVMSPFLFRRWIGRWGAVLASLMLLISPLLLYYNRYIRHDTPSILFAIIMAYSLLMYLNGPTELRRKSRWLYLFAGAMILNLGSKETSFIYIAIFLSFLILYWLVRVIQDWRNIPGKPVFYTLILGILFGGVLSLGMYIIVDIIPFQILPGRGLPLGDLSPLEQQSTVLWIGLTLLFALFVIVSTALWVFRDRFSRLPWREVIIIFLIALLTCIALVVIEELSHIREAAEDDAPEPLRWTPMILTWLTAIVALGFIVWSRRSSNDPRKRKDDRRGGIWGYLDQFPEFDFIILIVTLVLPWLTALVPYAMRGTDAEFAAIANALPPLFNQLLLNLRAVNTPEQVGQVIIGLLAWFPLMAVSIALGLVWNWKRWLVAAGIFYVIFAFFFTTVFTNISGLATGMVYSLGYWLEQQGVRRGSQPQYYYLLIIMPFYEFLPVIGSVAAMFAGTAVFWRQRRTLQEAEEQRQQLMIEQALQKQEETSEESGEGDAVIAQPVVTVQPIPETEVEFKGRWLIEIPFLLFLSWWSILNLVGYSLAGEKMPWLGTHLTVPLIFLTAWYFSRIFARIDWGRVRERGWILLLVLPLFFITLVQVVGPILIGRGPFNGLQTQQLQETYAWLGVLAIAIGVGYVIYRISKFTGWGHIRQLGALTVFVLLALVTFRSAWVASFINYDSAREFLVYAHAAPAVKTVLDDITEISLRTSDGLNMKFAYDNEVSWPYSWYFRNFTNAVFVGENPSVQNLQDTMVIVAGSANRSKFEPLVEDRYQTYRYNRMVWPAQDYFNLTAQRIVDTFNFSAQNPQAAAVREGIFDIWWSRDYSSYGTATNKDFSEVNWPVSDEMFVYVRNDLASQIWSYGIGDGVVVNPIDQQQGNSCVVNWSEQQAITVFEPSVVTLQRPLGITVGANGLVYVADELTSLIHIYDQDGNFVSTLTSTSQTFVRPNSVAVDEDGNVFVADTWNYQIQALDDTGNHITSWGQAGEFGFDAPVDPSDAFWGPRDVAVDEQGQIYVSDTGNKRTRVYRIEDGQAVHLYDIGSGGGGEGQLNEPSGVLVDSEGQVFVADTWNRRISVFSQEGEYVDDFPVRGWYDDLGNRPYIALDEERDQLYVTDPEAGRVLVYDTEGNCLGAFGQLGSENDLDNGKFQRTGGIAVDDEGFVYVTDSSAGRVLKFTPFEPPINEDDSVNEVVPESDENPDDAEADTLPELPENQAAG